MSEDLKFKNGKFKIMSLGDLHESLELDTPHRIKRRRDMHNFIKAGILALQPDLVVLLGDTCNHRDETEGFTKYKAALRDILKPVIDSGIPFCYVLGNHEHDQEQEELIVNAYREIENCIGENDPSCPRGNFNCNILVKNTAGTENILNLWFIDSNNCCDDPKISKYDWVHQDQIEWYEKKANEIKIANDGKTIPAIVFQHIPVIEEYELLRKAKPHEIPFSAVEGHHLFGKNKYMLKDGVEGYLGEGPCSPCYNGGQFASWKRTGDVIAAFFGHDHTNDFTGYVDGIMLGQNKTSGLCCYTDGCRSAIRLTTIDEADPWSVSSKIYHFKDFGLNATSLGPIEKRITDKQSIAMHKIGYATAGITAGAAAIAGIVALTRKIKKK